MSGKSSTSAPRSGWRLLRKSAFWLLIILLTPVLIWWLVNRIDEAPSAAAMHYAEPPAPQAPDADNAWLHLVGNGAAESIDPIVQGRAQVDEFKARLASASTPPVDHAALAQFPPALPLVRPDLDLDGSSELCPMPQLDCLDWVQRHQRMLERLQNANALRLQRFREAMLLPAWQALYAPAIEMPHPEVWIATLHLNLLALDLQRALEEPANGSSSALDALADWVDFWRPIRDQPTDAYSNLIAARRIEDAHQITNAWLDRRAAQLSRADQAALDRITMPAAVPLDWTETLRFEFRRFEWTMEHSVGSPSQILWRCLRGTTESGCLDDFALSSAFARQATLNLKAIHLTQMQRHLQADPTQLEQIGVEVGAAVEATFPALHDASTVARQVGYNFGGRILAAISIPAYDWHLRAHDREALRRMLVLKRLALARKIQSTEMASFLQEQLTALRNPYDAQPFLWDPLFREIHFRPRAQQYWQRERLAFGLASDQASSECDEPFLLSVTSVHVVPDSEEFETGYPLQGLYCGHGDEMKWHRTLEYLAQADPGDPRLSSMRSYHMLRVLRDGERVGVRAVLENQGKFLEFEAVLERQQDEHSELIRPLEDDGSVRLYLTLDGTQQHAE